MPMKMPMNANSEKIAKTSIGNPPAIASHPHETQPTKQSTADAADDAEDDPNMPPTTMTTMQMLTPETIALNETTEFYYPDRSHVTAYARSNQPSLLQSTPKDAAKTMTMPPRPAMTNSSQNPTPPSAPPNSKPRPTTISTGPSQCQPSNPINPPILEATRHPTTKPEAACARTKHELTATTETLTPQTTTHEHPTQHNTTTSTTRQMTTHNRSISPSTNPACTQDLAPAHADNPRNRLLECPTTAWIRETYAPVFQSLARLVIHAETLSNKISLLLNNHNLATHRNPIKPIPLTPYQNTQHHQNTSIRSQQKRSFPSPPLPLPMAKQVHRNQPRAKCQLTLTIVNVFNSITAALEMLTSPTVPNLLTQLTTQTHSQKLDPQQINHRHQKHTKHRHLPCPLLPNLHPYLRQCLPFTVTTPHPTYHRYLAHNFQPP